MSFCNVPPSCSRGNAALFGLGDEEREHHRGRGVDGHGRGDGRQIDVGEEVAHVGEAVDRHAAASDFTERHRIIGVESEQRRHVEGRRESLTPGGDDLLETLVGVEGGPEAGEHAHRSTGASGTWRRAPRGCRGRAPGTHRRAVRRPGPRGPRTSSRKRRRAWRTLRRVQATGRRPTGSSDHLRTFCPGVSIGSTNLGHFRRG